MEKIEIAPKRRRDYDLYALISQKRGYKENIAMFIRRISGKDYETIREYNNDEYNDYLEDWINAEVMLFQWISFNKTNLGSDLKRYNLTESELFYVRVIQYRLYKQLRGELLRSFINEFLEISQKGKQNQFARKQLILLKELDNRDIEKKAQREISVWFGVTDFELTYNQIQYLKTIRRYDLERPETFDIHNPECLILSDVLIRYKKYLQQFFKDLKKRVVPDAKKVLFKIKKEYENKLKDLHEELDDRLDKFLDDDKTPFETLQRILKSKNVKEEEGGTFFKCYNYVAYQIIIKLQSWFKNLSFDEITRSEKFIGRNGKILTGNDLSSA